MKKRKEFVHHFPSISPATKSRRLKEAECELYSAMMMEAEENVSVVDPIPSSSVTATEERALVLYDPIATPFLKSPSSTEFSIVVKADLIPGLKDYLLSWGNAKQDDPVEEDELRRQKSSEVSKDCLAVVPWVAFHSPVASEEIIPETGQPLEVEEAEMMEMD